MDDSIVVIQCAGRKRPTAGHLHHSDGRKVLFVAHPNLTPENDAYVYAHPDDTDDTGKSWRKKLLKYNDVHQGNADGNPLGLLPAWQLYQNPMYALLYRKYGPDNLYILSAGWGLIPADFLTPAYDITFSTAKNVDKYKRRGKRDSYDDLRMLPSDTPQPVVFFGGKDYVSLFCALTNQVKSPLHVIYNAIKPPDAPCCKLSKFETTTKTNWHYGAARAFAKGRMEQQPPC